MQLKPPREGWYLLPPMTRKHKEILEVWGWVEPLSHWQVVQWVGSPQSVFLEDRPCKARKAFVNPPFS